MSILDEASGTQLRTHRTPPLWLLALLTFSGTVAMHMFVPALPSAAVGFGAGAAGMQATISLYILGLAVGQLFYGPASDRFGRRPVLFTGLALYTLGGLAGAVAPSLHLLVAARLLQGIGGCAGMVVARAVIRDTFGLEGSTRRLALMNIMVTVGPAVGPLVGTVLLETLGWRSILIALGLLGMVDIALAAWLLPETDTPRQRLSSAALARSYGQLLRSPAFLGFAIGGGCATTSMYAFIAAAPFVFERQLHTSAAFAAGALATFVLGMWTGSILASRLAGRVRIARMLLVANLVSVGAACVLLAGVLGGFLSVPLVIGTMFLFMAGAGTAAPSSAAAAISVNPRVAGSASGLYGFTQMAVGALCTALAGIGDNPALAASMVLAGSGVVAQAAYRLALRNGSAS